MGTEQKKCGDLTDTDVCKMATFPFGHRAKDSGVITDTVVKKMATSTFGYRASQRLLCHH